MDLTLPHPIISKHISNMPTIVRLMCLQSTTLSMVMGKKNTKDKKFTKFKAVGKITFWNCWQMDNAMISGFSSNCLLGPQSIWKTPFLTLLGALWLAGPQITGSILCWLSDGRAPGFSSLLFRESTCWRRRGMKHMKWNKCQTAFTFPIIIPALQWEQAETRKGF